MFRLTTLGLFICAGCRASAPVPAEPLTELQRKAGAAVLSPEDRQFLDSTFRQYGPLWGGGVAGLEQRFQLDVTKTEQEFKLALTSRTPDRVSFELSVGRKELSMTTERSLPSGPELTTAELASANSALRRVRELWLLIGVEVVMVNLDQGIESLAAGQPAYTTRRFGTVANFYFGDLRGAVQRAPVPDPFCLSLDLETGAVRGVYPIELHPRGLRVLELATLDFLDRALGKNGNFGVYGDVTKGFRTLARTPNLAVWLVEADQAYQVGVSPKDGYGHELQFSVDRTTGTISDMSASHSVPAERGRDVDE